MKSIIHSLIPNCRFLAISAAVAAALINPLAAADRGEAYFSDWPEGKSPAVVGKRVAENFLPRQFRYQTDPKKVREGVIYPEVITWYGSLVVADLIKDKDLLDKLIAKFELYLTDEGAKAINPSAHVDYRVFGMLPLEIHRINQDKRCLELGLKMADAQWATTTPDGITTEARYWIDDMYMIPAVQVQAFRATKDVKYLDRAALAMSSYLDRLQKENGLFFHGENSHFYWGRGNGWMAAGAAELLLDLPESHPQRARILAGYRKMMKGLLEYQAEGGLWRQLIDKPASWPETSGSAMFAFGMITGVKNGWLDAATYGPAARKAWLALVDQLDEKANLKEVCVGTNKGFDEPYYDARPRTAGDLHGQAPMLWSAMALMR
ncbi:MAG: glycoside hydrolase family 88 protein [Akkermansiaceae bacterium]|jgi:rhamnogalacturonyl hydrolase YesR|nr:glycoside hydrolase family 88 protein [Akkermansiaceae bacterium]